MVIIDFKIDGMISAKEYNSLPFGRRFEHRRKIQEFQEKAKKNYLGTKRTKLKTALREFLKLYEAKQYYFMTREDTMWKDDSVEIWYL